MKVSSMNRVAGNLGIAANVGDLFSWQLNSIQSVFLQNFDVYVKMSKFAKNRGKTTIINNFTALSNFHMRWGWYLE